MVKDTPKKTEARERNNMTRDDIIKVFPDATEEQLKPILDMNSADIGKALKKQGTEADDLKAQLQAAQDTISKLQASASDVDSIKAELNKYKADEKKRQEEAAAAEAEKALSDRFEAVAKESNFVNEYTKQGVYAQFKAAVADKANAGKGDVELFKALVEGKQGILANPNPGVDISGPSKIDNAMLSAEAFKQMTLADRMKWANANPEAYARLSETMTN